MTRLTERPIRLIGGRYDGRWWTWAGDSTIEVRFMPEPGYACAADFGLNEPPISTTDVRREYYVVGYIAIDSGRSHLAFGRPADWSDADALRHLLGNPL